MSENQCRLFVGSLDPDVTSEDLHEAFTEYGRVAEARVIPDHTTGKSRCFGFVEMGSRGEAERALGMNGRSILNRRVEVKYAEPKKPRV